MFDILVKNAKIVDGSGSPWFYGNVAVKGEEIVGVGRVDGPATRVIDAEGQFLTPGFIDAHSHSDDSLLASPLAESKIRQGVTAEVIGQCGASAAPRKAAEGEYNYASLAEYLHLLETRGVSLNVIPLLGHGNLRQIVMGYDNRKATPLELQQMCQLTAESMEAGAFGFTTGLIYPPGSYADAEEITAIAKVVSKYGGIYATHMRDEDGKLVESVAETIAVGEAALLPVHISHHKVCGEPNWGLVKESLKLIDEKRQQGVDITMDQYPYIATSTGLKVIIPQWAHAGGTAGLRARFTDAESRASLTQEILSAEKRWDWILVASCNKEHNKVYEGKTAAEIAQMTGKAPVDACLDLLLDEDFNVGMVRYAMCEEDVELVMQHPHVMIGSDASARATYGKLSEGKPHPRAYGTFTRVLETYVRERNVLTLEDAVRKMTNLTAMRFQLWDRGLVRPGFKADLVLFDLAKCKENCTFAEPHAYPDGVSLVCVNGTIVVEAGEHLGVTPGKVLRMGK